MFLFIRIFPLLILPALVYAVFAFGQGEGVQQALLAPTMTISLPSGAELVVTTGYLFIVFSAAVLFVEIVKSTRPTNIALMETGLSFAVFTVALILFLLLRPFGTIEFFLIMIMMLLDFLAGAVIMAFVARRDISYQG